MATTSTTCCETSSPTDWAAPTSLPGWTVHDVVAHMVGTESMLSGVATPEADIDVSTLEHVRNDIGVMNEHWVRNLRGLTPAQLHDKFRSVTAERHKALSGLPDAEWNNITATPAGPDTYGRFMRVRIFDCWMHELDIRDAVERPGDYEDLVGSASAQALDEMAASMGFVVGKLGGAPDGSRVSIELTGPLRRVINVAMEGRGRVVRGFRRGGADVDDRDWTGCCSPGSRAGGRRPLHMKGRSATAATRVSGAGSSSTSTT